MCVAFLAKYKADSILRNDCEITKQRNKEQVVFLLILDEELTLVA